MVYREVPLKVGRRQQSESSAEVALSQREREKPGNKMGLSVEMKTFKGVKRKDKQSLSHALKRGSFSWGFR